jgi:hypothetical protein
MLFGHNSNVASGGTTYHVQTEDRGEETALIDTTVFCRGRVLHRRTNNYFDLLPLNQDSEDALKLRLAEQHRAVLEEIRSGKLAVAPPPGQSKPAGAAGATAAPAAAANANSSGPSMLVLELTNPRTWLAGKRATLQIAVRQKGNGNPAGGAKVVARVDGSAEPFEFSVDASPQGQALLGFEMPRLSGSDPALVIEASQGAARGQLRFQLRAKPRVPAPS